MYTKLQSPAEHSITMSREADSSPTGSPNRLLVTHRSDKSLFMSLLQSLVRPLRPRLVKPKQVVASASPRASPPIKVKRQCHLTERLVNDMWIYDLASGKQRPVEENEAPLKRIVYFAGGGWQMPPSSDHWAFAAELVRRLPNTIVSIVSHPLAPKFPASVSMPSLRRLYDTLMQQAADNGERVLFAGDSSGGNIALCLVMWALTDPSARAPAAIVAISPATDLRHIHPGLQEADKLDPVLSLAMINSTARAWTGGAPNRDAVVPITADAKPILDGDWSASDPRVSPVLASLTDLVKHGVKVHGVTGSYDLLAVEGVEFRDRCQREGVEGEWLDWEGQMHCFPLAFRYGLRESSEAMDWVLDVLRRT